MRSTRMVEASAEISWGTGTAPVKGMGAGYSYGKGITTPDRDPSPDIPCERGFVAMAAPSGTVWALLCWLCIVLFRPCFGPALALSGAFLALLWPCVGRVLSCFGLVLVSFGPEVVPFRPCFWPALVPFCPVLAALCPVWALCWPHIGPVLVLCPCEAGPFYIALAVASHLFAPT